MAKNSAILFTKKLDINPVKLKIFGAYLEGKWPVRYFRVLFRLKVDMETPSTTYKR